MNTTRVTVMAALVASMAAGVSAQTNWPQFRGGVAGVVADDPALYVHVELDWHHDESLLSLAVPVDVRAGVACQTCHGDVGAMRTVEQVAPLTMGWCVGCHEQRQAPDDCLICHY